jgi:hypothetical protein
MATNVRPAPSTHPHSHAGLAHLAVENLSLDTVT